MNMEDYIKHLDMILSSTGEKLLTGAGKISHDKALEKAKAEYKKYQVKTISPVEQEYLNTIKEISKEIKKKKIIINLKRKYLCDKKTLNYVNFFQKFNIQSRQKMNNIVKFKTYKRKITM